MASRRCSSLILLLSLVYQWHSSSSSNSLRDRIALLSFKSLVTHDPHGSLASWGNSYLHFCLWQGVKCSNHTVHPRVTELDLGALDLAGSVSRSIGNLTFLQRLHLPENQLAGTIPAELGLLSHLQHLNLSFNRMEGEIPQSISQCFSLQTIDFGDNFLSGIIPASLGALQVLEHLSLDNNKLEAREESDWGFLNALSNCTNLQFLDLSSNSLGGMLPNTISNLSLNLESLMMNYNKISGTIPPSFSKLVGIKQVLLSSNLLTGSIPAQLGKLHKLELLSLDSNHISGSIPPAIGNISTLKFLVLSSNNLEGTIPECFGNLSLLFLYLPMNNLTGGIPSSLGNLHLLYFLALQNNQLSGSIPESLGKLQSATHIQASSNKLSGEIPHSLWNLSSLVELYLRGNMLVGELPQLNFLQNMPHLQSLVLTTNNLHGPIPTSLSNSSALDMIDLTENRFSGTIPIEFGNLKRLTRLLLRENNLEAVTSSDWEFLGALKNCTFLNYLILSGNERIAGVLPDSVGNLSRTLIVFDLSGCQVSGSIPAAVGNLMNLTVLWLYSNQFNGSIPASIGNLQMLNDLDLGHNELSGQIPSSFGNLAKLNRLYLSFNNLGGQIPSGLGNCKHLEVLELERNGLTGSIPTEIFAIYTIYMLNFSDNALEGSLSLENGSLINLVGLDVSNNNFSGKIPDSFGQCVELQQLYMGHNFFEGVIPPSFRLLRSLQELDLSRNRLSGEIPKGIQDLKSLVYLNLSDNSLEGELPMNGIFSNTRKTFVFGNDGLCGGIPDFRLQPCSIHSSSRWRTRTLVIITVASIVGVALLTIMFFLGCTKWRRKVTPTFSTEEHLIGRHMRISYAELLKATNQFSNENLIGVGGFGSVYKGYMDRNPHKVVAVKVLDLHQRGASRSFDAECKVLRNMRHRNLVSLLTACSSIDFRGHDFKALVFEFMPNGDLERWLHPNEQSSTRRLSLLQRLNIAIDVASALGYLHHHGPEPVVHCDLKPSNVLLDDEMTAHVGDFGLARLIADPKCESAQLPTGSAALKGTIGYVAPEYGVANKISTEGDVFSFGVILLELFTGKSPTSETFRGDLSLRRFVETAFPERMTDILDPMLYSADVDGESASNAEFTERLNRREMECLISTLRIALSCSEDSPIERMNVIDALNELHKIQNVFLSPVL